MSILARLGIAITANSSELKKGLDDATKEVRAFNANVAKANKEAAKAAQELGATMARVAGVAAAAAATMYKAFSYADEISDTAAAFDITVSSLLKMQSALQLSGGNAENLSNLMSKLSVNTQKARDGADDVRDAFKDLKISGQDVEKLGTDELFARVAYELSQIEDPVKRNALAFEVLGKAAKGVDWKNYWETYSSGKDATESVSIGINEAAKAWDNLGKSAKSTLQLIVVLLTPIASLINTISETIDRIKSGEGGQVDFGAAFGGAPGEESSQITYGNTRAPSTAKKPTVGEKGYSKGAKSAEGFASEAESIRQATQELIRQDQVFKQRLEQQTLSMNLTKNEKEMVDQIYKIEEDRSKLLQNAQKEIAVEEKKKTVNTEKIAALKEQIVVINQLKDAEIVASVDATNARREEQNQFTTGWQNAFRQWAEDLDNEGKRGAEGFNSLIGEMNKGIDMFVDHGIFGFSQFAESVIKDLLKIELKMQASQLLRAGIGMFGGMFGGGASGVENISTAQWTSGNFATGGMPDVGVPSLVGENGPELFVPKTQGTIIPNQQLSSVLGGGAQNVFNGPYIANMNAIDTQSGVQFLAKNKMTIYSLNQSAARSIPTSR